MSAAYKVSHLSVKWIECRLAILWAFVHHCRIHSWSGLVWETQASNPFPPRLLVWTWDVAAILWKIKEVTHNLEISEAVCSELRETQEVTHATQEKVVHFKGKCSVGGFCGPNGSKWNAEQNDNYKKLLQWIVSRLLMLNGMGVSAYFHRRHHYLR